MILIKVKDMKVAMTEEEKIQYVLKMNAEGAYERDEAVPINILEKSQIQFEERLIIDYIRRNPDELEKIMRILKK